MRRCALIGLGAIVAILGSVLIAVHGEKATRQKYERIHLGMHLDAVYEIMGGRGGAWDRFREEPRQAEDLPGGGILVKMVIWEKEGTLNWNQIPVAQMRRIQSWTDDSGGIAVCVDEDGVVTDKLIQVGRHGPSMLDRLLAFTGF